jgi:hypothetical protein
MAPPVRPKLYWQDDGERVSLSKYDAKLLYDYLVDVEAYIKATQ